MLLSSILIVFWALTSVNAGTIAGEYRRATIEELTPVQISQFTPFTRFASAAYCSLEAMSLWTCGADCEANSDFMPTATGGDGGFVQRWYVGYSPSLHSVVVAHQGTDPVRIEAIIADVAFVPTVLNPELFPGVTFPVLVHGGFALQHARAAKAILSAVKITIARHNATKVALVGHSLGGALALLDSVYLPLHIKGVEFHTITYGLPRVGNIAFANYVDKHTSLTRINNKRDPIPTTPLQLLSYRHPSGEVHITGGNKWLACPGQENPSFRCTFGSVPLLLVGNPLDHHGSYNGVNMGDGC
ncbi:hypothetical protein AGABI1DRAFT_67808 [Agaricus bisporus var. burnettii JB137-S8]|uniref:Fungal lipase-type domain-containing protein n=1 Tax=Agaricus bisporus var. burnettii (strain JB137-S8 / ATCC MYA-4627 / FGSC 10392) TaxID=597362 RepID=K5XLG3_AGABU|nr:uncharacterized protein AGABI1DRAFT_67808 [Agaricus bisporus var. burnettii JB137-S8]EKM84418.1 hypothetical protein AGABI1DRAFT_67808 [Agaricus bisporus var. burnettii JB137-S8]